MWLSLVLAAVNLAVGGYLLWYAFSGRQRRPELALVVGAVLLVAAIDQLPHLDSRGIGCSRHLRRHTAG